MRLVLSPRPAVKLLGLCGANAEAWGWDIRGAHRVADALSALTDHELHAFAEFACLATAETASARSWRYRLLRETVALSRVDSSLFAVALDIAIHQKAIRAEPEPLFPFIADADWVEGEGGE